jgi:hypothetical protein
VPFTALEDAIWFRAACRLRRLKRKAIGLVGVGEGVDACDVALYLAPALVEACDAPVAVLLPYERAVSAIEWEGVSLARAQHWPPDPDAMAAAVTVLCRDHGQVLVPLPYPEPHANEVARELDGVVLVARVGGVRESELAACRASFGEKQLGVLLLDESVHGTNTTSPRSSTTF